MKKIQADAEDSLRPEYMRSDLGNPVRGKFANTQVEFRQFTEALLTCIGEEEGMQFVHHSSSNRLARHNLGDWTYEIDNGNQITLRYWLNEFGNIEEPVPNPAVVLTAQQRTELHKALSKGVKELRGKVFSASATLEVESPENSK